MSDQIVWELALHRSIGTDDGTSFYYPGDTFNEEGLLKLFFDTTGVEWAKKLGVVRPKRIRG